MKLPFRCAVGHYLREQCRPEVLTHGCGVCVKHARYLDKNSGDIQAAVREIERWGNQ